MFTGDKTPVVCCLGRYGDIINALPIAYELNRTIGKPKFVVSRQFWTILTGVGYLTPVVWDLPYNSTQRAVTRLEGKHEHICQAYEHPDQRHLTDSYQKEGWRLAGWLDRWNTIPTVFDSRNASREFTLVDKTMCSPRKRTILFSGKSVSSPIDTSGILKCIIKEFSGDYHIINLDGIVASEPYDLLALMDASNLLITVDTMHLHLARASNIPMVAIINNGWLGSVPKDGSKAIRYSDVTPELVIAAAKNLL